MFQKDFLHISVIRSIYLSLRFRGKIAIYRGTRIRLDRGSRVRVPRGCRLLIGKDHTGGAPASLDLRRNARLTINGTGLVWIARSTRILIQSDGHLEIGGGTAINFSTTITCFKHISIGLNSGLSWNTNVFDGNNHEITVAGVPRQLHKPVLIGDHVWVGAGATVMGATIGDGSVVGAASVITSVVPSRVLVVGNPPRIIGKDISFKWF